MDDLIVLENKMVKLLQTMDDSQAMKKNKMREYPKAVR